MTNRARAGIVAFALAVAAIAFVALRPDDDKQPATTAETTTTATGADTATAEPPPRATLPTAPPGPREIAIRGGEVVGGAPTIKVKRGDSVRILVTADAPDTLHLHGYDIERAARPGRPARFVLTADTEGIFELESHTAEHHGKQPKIATLVVEPD